MITNDPACVFQEKGVVHPEAAIGSIQRDLERSIIIDDRNLPWHDAVVARLEHVCRLRPGWDGYDARPVDFGAASFALRILHSVCTPSTPAPSIVPGVAGDLQIEWHTADWDVEVHVLAQNLVEAWRARADRHDTEGELFKATTNFTVLYDWLISLAEPALADFTSATG